MIIVFIILLILVMIFWKINQNVYMFYNAQPPKPAPKVCSKPCPKIFKPVYDTAGKQYANSCQFEIAKCKNSKLQLGGVPNNETTPPKGKTTPPKGKTTPGIQPWNALSTRKITPGKTTPRKITQAASSNCDAACKPRAIREIPTYDTDGTYYFDDWCIFARAKCKNPKLEKYDCAKHNCSNKSTPVCDNKGKKYSNVCEFLKETCKDKGLKLAPCSDSPMCEDVNPEVLTCKPIPDCTPSDMDKLLPEYCEINSDNSSQVCVYVNNGKACRTVISPKKYNNEETKMKVSEIIKNAQPPELDIQIYPYTNT